MKTADLKIGDEVAYKSSKYSGANHCIVRSIRDRKSYGWDRTNTVGLVRYDLPDDADFERLTFWVRPQTIVSSWSDEAVRRAEAKKQAEERQAHADAKVAANRPRLEAVERLAEILSSTAGGPLTEHQENRLLLGASFNVYLDLDKLEAIQAALTEVSS